AAPPVAASPYGRAGRRLWPAGAAATVRRGDPPPPPAPAIPRAGAAASHGAISADGAWAVTRSFNDSTRIWNLATGKSTPLSNKVSGWVQYIAFSPNGKRVLVANGFSPWGPFSHGHGENVVYPDQKQSRVYDVATGDAVSDSLAHAGTVVHAAFSGDGRRVVTGSYDTTARVWEVLTGKHITPPLKHDGNVMHVGFSPDGRRVVTAGWDGAIRLWDATSGEQIGEPIKAG